MPQAQVGYDDLQDPEAIANWPLTLGRDGARTPMPWRAKAAAAGFTTGRPWLPIGQGHAERAVDLQDADNNSVLNFTRRILALRSRSPAMRTGDIAFVELAEPLLAFRRRSNDQTVLALFNLSAKAQPLPAGMLAGQRELISAGADGVVEGWLPGYGLWIGEAV